MCIGDAPSSESYLNIPNLLSAAMSRGAQAIHPVRRSKRPVAWSTHHPSPAAHSQTQRIRTHWLPVAAGP